MAATSTATPTAITAPAKPATTRPVVGLPNSAKSTRAHPGSSSLKYMFARNVTRADPATAAAEKPHDAYIEYERPTATTPPAGMVIATAVDDSPTTAACANERPGIAATSIGQYVIRFHR